VTPRRKLDPFEQPLAALLLKLRDRYGGASYRCTPAPDRWDAICPACDGGVVGRSLTIREPTRGGPIVLRCTNGCTRAAIEKALEVPGWAAQRTAQLEHLLDQSRAALDSRSLALEAALAAWVDLEDENTALRRRVAELERQVE
jgi:hypothetical protein